MKKNQAPKQPGLIDVDYEDDAAGSDHEDSLRSSRIPATSNEDSPTVSRDEDDVEGADLQSTHPDEAAENDDDSADFHTPLPTRGPTLGKKQTKESIKRSGKIKVEYNRMGMMVGKPATDISSLCGVLARTSVPINYDDWRSVPDEIKARLWDIVTVSFLHLLLYSYYSFKQ